MLPFDLHVLGLPLAFILSQDQTLRCKKSFCPKANNLSLSRMKIDLGFGLLLLLSCQRTSVSFSRLLARKRDGKGNHFFIPANFSENYFRDRKSTRLNSSHVRISFTVFCL